MYPVTASVTLYQTTKATKIKNLLNDIHIYTYQNIDIYQTVSERLCVQCPLPCSMWTVNITEQKKNSRFIILYNQF